MDVSTMGNGRTAIPRNSRLRGKEISLVKVLWSQVDEGDVTWEVELDMREDYPHLFESRYGILGDSRLSERASTKREAQYLLPGFPRILTLARCGSPGRGREGGH
ncbi:hypothetical protein Lal_00001010 [Lupinus albus]|nr:hypothetical protein Lal_00001010 [Lupinus albus]